MRIPQKAVGIVLVLIGGASLALSGFQGRDIALPEKPNADARTACKVLTVYDGDTLGCDLDRNGKVDLPGEQIRLLGIDSPEMRYSRKNPAHGSENPVDEPLAPEASQWLESRTLRRTVYLEFDQLREDKYKRSLAYVYGGSDETVSLNEQLLEAGLARTLFIGRNRRYEKRFTQAEAAARRAGLGLWGMPEAAAEQPK